MALPDIIAGTVIKRGAKNRLEIPVARLLTGVFASLPVCVLRGTRPGPTVWLSAALHGDEIVGVEVIRSLIERIEPKKLRGAIVAVPVVNVFGFVNESRYLPDRRDLNRSFPGSARGSLAARLADLFMTEIVRHCTHGIDLHSGSDHRTNLPHVRANLESEDSRALAEAFGTTVLVHGHGPDGSLRNAAAALGIPCIVYEAGEAHRFDADAVTQGVDGVLRVLGFLDMVPHSVVPDASLAVRVDKTRWVRAKQSGLMRLSTRLGAQVKVRQRLGVIGDAFGEQVVDIRAPVDGIVLGLAQNPTVHRGEAIVHLAISTSKEASPSNQGKTSKKVKTSTKKKR